jgi:hypothetical protein
MKALRRLAVRTSSLLERRGEQLANWVALLILLALVFIG